MYLQYIYFLSGINELRAVRCIKQQTCTLDWMHQYICVLWLRE
jgi:hypothetical protein